MKPIDDELKNALRQEDPPEGFAERVLARARQEEAPRPGFAGRLRAFFRLPVLRWGLAFGLGCLIVIFAAQRYRELQRERRQAEIATAQARVALQIASAKLNAAFRDAAQPVRRRSEN